MSLYTTRVELHDANDYDDYETLHKAMENKGFTRYIADSNSGTKYHLPWAEYNFSGNENRSDVLNLAIAASKITRKKASILVTESNGRTWDNLSLA